MENQKIKSFHDLVMWQKGKDFAVAMYRATEQFPKYEIYGITSQLRRAAVSIPSNIAEGFKRSSSKEKIYFLRMSYGSAAEIETQLIIAKELGYVSEQEYGTLARLLDEIARMIHAVINKL